LAGASSFLDIPLSPALGLNRLPLYGLFPNLRFLARFVGRSFPVLRAAPYGSINGLAKAFPAIWVLFNSRFLILAGLSHATPIPSQTIPLSNPTIQ
jgi:hypothetical protein